MEHNPKIGNVKKPKDNMISLLKNALQINLISIGFGHVSRDSYISSGDITRIPTLPPPTNIERENEHPRNDPLLIIPNKSAKLTNSPTYPPRNSPGAIKYGEGAGMGI